MSKKAANTDKIIEEAKCATSQGGQRFVETWPKSSASGKKLAACPLIDPLKDKPRGFSLQATIASIVFSFCSGGSSISEARRPAAILTQREKLLDVDGWAQKPTIGN